MNNVQFPTKMNWKQIESKYFLIIFPEGLEEECKEFAAIIDSCVPPDSYSIETKPKNKWPILINTTLSESNGYVASAPEHSQLYMVPAQAGFLGTADWLPMLWTHELRHILQNDKTKRGFTAFAGWIFGQYGTAILSHFALPSWVWEGDAVLTETLLTTTGRGSLAEFERSLRTNTLNGERYSYAKASLGSYGSFKTRVQSWYVMGYHLCTYLRKEYGIDDFNRIIKIASSFSFSPLIMNIAVKIVTKKSINEIYKDCIEELDELWTKQLEHRTFSDASILLPADEKSSSEYSPLGKFPNGDLAILRTSTSTIPTLMRLPPDGKPRSLRKIYPSEPSISFNGETFCWTETTNDPRWGNVSWSRVRIFNPETGEFRFITGESRFFSVSISPDGEKIAAVEFSEGLVTSLVTIDSSSGKILQRFELPKSYTAMQTCWDDDETIIYIRQGNWQKSLRKINIITKEDSSITEPSTINIKNPYAKDGKVFYVSEDSGLENIHVADISTGKTELLVSRTYAAINPIVNGNDLFFADYSVNGFSVARADLEQLKNEKDKLQNNIALEHVDYFAGLEGQEKYAGYLSPDKKETLHAATDYKIEDYCEASGLINFHSRFKGSSFSGNGLTLDFYADSVLNNSSSRIFIGYDPLAKEALGGFQGYWSGLYPIITYGAELEMPKNDFGEIYNSSLFTGLILPFDFSSGIYNNFLTIQSTFYLSSNLYPAFYHNPMVRTYASWSLTEKMAKRDIFPNLGIAISAGWKYALNSAYYNFLFAETDVYLPGIFENHGIHLDIDASYNLKNAQELSAPTSLPKGFLPNGYKYPFVMNTGIDYMMPIAYPDLDIFNVIYISRLSTNAFFDVAFANYDITTIFDIDTSLLMTTGLELFFDFNLFNITTPLRGGIRILYNFTDENFRFEDTTLLLGFNF